MIRKVLDVPPPPTKGVEFIIEMRDDAGMDLKVRSINVDPSLQVFRSSKSPVSLAVRITNVQHPGCPSRETPRYLLKSITLQVLERGFSIRDGALITLLDASSPFAVVIKGNEVTYTASSRDGPNNQLYITISQEVSCGRILFRHHYLKSRIVLTLACEHCHQVLTGEKILIIYPSEENLCPEVDLKFPSFNPPTLELLEVHSMKKMRIKISLNCFLPFRPIEKKYFPMRISLKKEDYPTCFFWIESISPNPWEVNPPSDLKPNPVEARLEITLITSTDVDLDSWEQFLNSLEIGSSFTLTLLDENCHGQEKELKINVFIMKTFN